MKKKLIAILGLSIVLSALPATAQVYYGYSGSFDMKPYWNKIGDASVEQGQSLSITASAQDDGGDPLFYQSVQMPENASFNPTTRVFSFAPSFNQLGSFPVTLSVTDNKSAPIYTTFYVTVTNNYNRSYNFTGTNQAPYFDSTASYHRIYPGDTLRFTVRATDPEGREVRYSVSNLPEGASFDAPSRTFSWKPDFDQRGTYTFAVYASDGAVVSIPLSITVVVAGGVTAPGVTYPSYSYSTPSYNTPATYANQYGFVTSPSTVAAAGTLYSYSARAVSPTGGVVNYTLVHGPEGAYINPVTGLLTWSVPASAVSGQTIPMTISAATGYNMPITQDFSLTITGGVPAVKTVIVSASAPVSYSAAPVTTGRTILAQQNYVYSATAGGPLIGRPASIEAFNVSVRAAANGEMIVSWDTNQPTRGEVVFGYNSQARPTTAGGQLLPDNRAILNYDFTTGILTTNSTRHEVSLGALAMGRTYYLRVISRTDELTNISRELVFIPVATAQGNVEVEQFPGAASAKGTLGSFLTSGGFLVFLAVLTIALTAYVLATGGSRSHYSSLEA